MPSARTIADRSAFMLERTPTATGYSPKGTKKPLRRRRAYTPPPGALGWPAFRAPRLARQIRFSVDPAAELRLLLGPLPERLLDKAKRSGPAPPRLIGDIDARRTRYKSRGILSIERPSGGSSSSKLIPPSRIMSHSLIAKPSTVCAGISAISSSDLIISSATRSLALSSPAIWYRRVAACYWRNSASIAASVPSSIVAG